MINNSSGGAVPTNIRVSDTSAAGWTSSGLSSMQRPTRSDDAFFYDENEEELSGSVQLLGKISRQMTEILSASFRSDQSATVMQRQLHNQLSELQQMLVKEYGSMQERLIQVHHHL